MLTARGAFRLVEFAALVLLLLFVARANFLLKSPYPTDYGEGEIWTYAHLLATTGTYLVAPEQAPFVRADAPPLFPRLHAALGPTLRIGRLLGLIGTLLAAFSVGLILHTEGVELRRAVLWSVIFLGCPAVHEWAAECRPENLALGLTLLGVAIAMRPGRELLSVPIFAAAAFSRLSAIAGPLALVIALRLRNEQRRAWTVGAVFAALVSLTMLLLHWRSHGELGKHLIGYGVAGGFDGLGLAGWLVRFAVTFPVFLPCALVAARGHSTVAIYIVVALATVVRAAVPAATASAVIEATAGCILGAGLFFERRIKTAKNSDRQVALAQLLLVQLVLICNPGRPLELRDLRRESLVQAQAVTVLVAMPEPVLAEDPGLALAAGKSPVGAPSQLARLCTSGQLNPAALLAEIEVGRFSVLLVGARLRAIPGFREVLARRYRRDGGVGNYEVWRPAG